MNFLKGIQYNFKGLIMGFRNPKLLMLGVARFVVLLVFAAAGAAVALSFHNDLLQIMWEKPDSIWIVWVWHLLSWLLAIALLGISTVVSYLVSQILFSVVIMDLMSRVTEKKITGHVLAPPEASLFKQFLYLVRQELPRAVVPVLCLLLLMFLGWLTPFGAVFSVISTALAAVFLAWDHTDLVPARRMVPFKQRFSIFQESFLFHLGFGLPFLIPGLNILLLSFAPVGATLFHTGTRQSSALSTVSGAAPGSPPPAAF